MPYFWFFQVGFVRDVEIWGRIGHGRPNEDPSSSRTLLRFGWGSVWLRIDKLPKRARVEHYFRPDVRF